jgi:hypothetical protein
VLGKVEDVGEADDPEGDEAAPEVVVDGARIFQPEDEDVLREQVGVEVEQDLGPML